MKVKVSGIKIRPYFYSVTIHNLHRPYSLTYALAEGGIAEKVFVEQDLENVVKYSSSVDVEMKKYRCNMCEYSTSHKGHFRDHFKKHDGEKSYKCNQCDYASVRASSLKAHLIAHSGVKSIKWDDFDSAFAQPRDFVGYFELNWREWRMCALWKWHNFTLQF